MALHRKRRAGTVLALALALGLAACGGGGGGSSDPIVRVPEDSQDLNLASSNYETAGRASVANVFVPIGVGDVGVFDPIGAAPWLLRLSVDLTRRALRSPGTPLALLLGIQLRQTLPCSGGGSLVVSLADSNSNGRFDNGDGIALEAQSCREEDGTVLQGRVSFAVQSLSGFIDSSSYGATLAVTLSAFSATRGADTVQGDGTLNFTQTQTPTVSELKLSTDFMMFSGRQDGQPFTTTLSGVKLTLRTETVTGVSRTTISYEGQISSSGLGGKRVIVTTPQPLVITGSDRYPSSGQLMVQGNGGSALRISSVNATQARLEVDAEGDGRYEAQTTKSWAELK
ncbi:hypothetical protein ACS5PN_04845 [Roseateles sp. NT4]|uniref:hypothetical protein n=1 Tax=Roseateles sp. NT4 TaxID=3453715 RepID=UPI003EEAA804